MNERRAGTWVRKFEVFNPEWRIAKVFAEGEAFGVWTENRPHCDWKVYSTFTEAVTAADQFVRATS